jgi:Tfp pilus assembly protein PilV
MRFIRGISLIEVLLSISILSGGLVAVYQPLLSSLDILNYADVRSEASRLASDFIWQLEQDVQRMGELSYENKVGILLGQDRTYQYDLNVYPVSKLPQLRELELSVSWTVGGRQKHINRLSYMVFEKGKI